MPYIGNVINSFAVETGNINDQAVTAPKLSATGGTDGQVLALDAGGNLVWTSDPAGQWVTSGNDIYYNTGNVGIGTASPGAALHISNSVAEIRLTDSDGDGDYANIISGATGNLFLSADAGDGGANSFMAFLVDNSEKARIDSSGFVGIGTLTPGALLDVAGGVPEIRLTDTNGGAYHTFDGPGNGSLRISADAGNGGALASTIQFSVDGTERMRIDNSGRLLIGTTTNVNYTATTASLQLVSDDSANDPRLLIRANATTDGAAIDFGGGAQRNGVIQGESGALLFYTNVNLGTSNVAERVRITSDGDFNCFTNHTNVHIARSASAAGTTDSIYVGVRSATTTTNGTVVYRVYTNGTYATISDQNQKKNIETTRDGYLEDLNKLRVVKYNWNEQEDTDSKELGLIAQEVEQVFPGLVTSIAEDAQEQQHKGIKTSVLPFMLLKALQEASAQITELKARVAALESA